MDYLLYRVKHSEAFWCLMDELNNDSSGFLHNRATILDAYVNGNLYGLQLNENKHYDLNPFDSIYCNCYISCQYYLFPCFCIKENDKAIIIWTHTRARNKGFAKKLVELLKIKSVYNPLPESIGFWEKCNIITPNLKT